MLTHEEKVPDHGFLYWKSQAMLPPPKDYLILDDSSWIMYFILILHIQVIVSFQKLINLSKILGLTGIGKNSFSGLKKGTYLSFLRKKYTIFHVFVYAEGDDLAVGNYNNKRRAM